VRCLGDHGLPTVKSREKKRGGAIAGALRRKKRGGPQFLGGDKNEACGGQAYVVDAKGE